MSNYPLDEADLKEHPSNYVKEEYLSPDTVPDPFNVSISSDHFEVWEDGYIFTAVFSISPTHITVSAGSYIVFLEKGYVYRVSGGTQNTTNLDCLRDDVRRKLLKGIF